jgi:hypothetical protein
MLVLLLIGYYHGCPFVRTPLDRSHLKLPDCLGWMHGLASCLKQACNCGVEGDGPGKDGWVTYSLNLQIFVPFDFYINFNYLFYFLKN